MYKIVDLYCGCTPTLLVQKVYLASLDKGWGIKALEELPKGRFLFELVGEVLYTVDMDMMGCSKSNFALSLDAD